MNWQLRRGTANAKLGATAYVVTLDRQSCPDSCALKGAGCYAESGPLAISWRRVSSGNAKHDGVSRWTGKGFKGLAATLRAVVPQGATLRIGDAGDPSHRGRVSLVLLEALGHLLATRGVRSIIYTHADPSRNSSAIERAAVLGLALNFSRHGTAPREGVPQGAHTVTTVLDSFWTGAKARDGITRCPAEYSDTDCVRCQLCALPRKATVGFTIHGSRKLQAAGVSA